MTCSSDYSAWKDTEPIDYSEGKNEEASVKKANDCSEEKRESDKADRRATWLEVVIAAGSLLVATATLAQACIASHSSSNQAKVAAAFSLHEKRLQEQQVVEQFEKVNKVIREVRTTYPIFSSAKQRSRFEKAVLDHSKETTVNDAISFALEFYEGVANCVAQNVCDRETAEHLFKNDVQEFAVIFSPVICEGVWELRDDESVKVIQDFYKPKHPICVSRFTPWGL